MLFLADLVSKVGPATFGEDNLYQYAVVWSPNFYNSFVLARDVAYFNENYKTEVKINKLMFFHRIHQVAGFVKNQTFVVLRKLLMLPTEIFPL